MRTALKELSVLVETHPIWITPAQRRISIPYPAEKHPNGADNHGYFDLEQNPAQIANIPELSGLPELYEFVRRVNAPESLFRTLACGTVLPLVPHFKAKVASYVCVCFDVLHWNRSFENFAGLYRAFELRLAKRGVSGAIGVEFEIHPAMYRQHGIDGWALTVSNFGDADSGPEARIHWAAGLRLVQDFLDAQNTTYASYGQDQLRVS